MSRIYHIMRYRLDGRDRYLLWYFNDGDRIEADGVVIDPDGTIPVFRTHASTVCYATKEGLSPWEEQSPNLVNLDILRIWLKRKRPGQINCEEFLSAWNLFADVSASVGGSFDPDKALTQKIYRKLLWGNNFPSLTPPGKCYEPLWSGAEVAVMRQVLGDGLHLFRHYIQLQPELARAS